MRILAIDPGTRMCGYSLFNDDKLSDCGIVRTKKKDLVLGAAEMAMALPRCIDVLTIEKMRIYRPRPGQNLSRLPNPEALVNISIVSGVFSGFITAKAEKYYLPYANDWKSRLPKEQHNAIISSLAPGATKIMDKNKVAQSYRNHVLDAVGLGLWTIEQERKTK